MNQAQYPAFITLFDGINVILIKQSTKDIGVVGVALELIRLF